MTDLFYLVPISNENTIKNWQLVAINECSEPLVPLNNINPHIICEGPQFVREQVAKKLIAAVQLLPDRCNFLIRSSYRSYEVQKKLFDEQYEVVKKQNPDAAKEVIQQITEKSVSFPSKNFNAPSPHSTGGAVDLTLLNGNEKFEMGAFSEQYVEQDKTNYFEELAKKRMLSPEEITVLINRRILYNIMTNVGFTNNPNEWWHYDFGDQFWAIIKRKVAIYGYAEI